MISLSAITVHNVRSSHAILSQDQQSLCTNASISLVNYFLSFSAQSTSFSWRWWR